MAGEHLGKCVRDVGKELQRPIEYDRIVRLRLCAAALLGGWLDRVREAHYVESSTRRSVSLSGHVDHPAGYVDAAVAR